MYLYGSHPIGIKLNIFRYPKFLDITNKHKTGSFFFDPSTPPQIPQLPGFLYRQTIFHTVVSNRRSLRRPRPWLFQKPLIPYHLLARPIPRRLRAACASIGRMVGIRTRTEVRGMIPDNSKRPSVVYTSENGRRPRSPCWRRHVLPRPHVSHHQEVRP